ncbi:NifB/NifX family molybdenum-iron cluster-binding protein [Tepidibacter mesophilus]|uniref:NifB/NifX family molybdenum-iron cluster-binding protein n=1 Tax=Tepidibacter mesophilus TaxID=655607 RepID=UPI000C0796FE|nr:NifB/NifX family molybdenum-iron cluster-binding protein [Tepidibacter mesophilus]
MKLCISSITNKENSQADSRFGRCPYFAIYNTENNTFEFIENSGITSPQGAGIAAAQQIADQKVEAVITGNMGPNAMKIIDAAGIKTYKINNETIKDAVKLYIDNKLPTIDKAGPSHLGMQK